MPWLLLLVVFSGSVLAHEKIVLHYSERPPYTLTGEDHLSLSGLAGTRVITVLRDANIPFAIRATPPLRQIDIIRENSGRDCTFDWYKTSERERFARFSAPFAKDSPYVFIAATSVNIPKPLTLSMIAQSGLVLVRADGYSFGQQIDPLLTSGTLRNISIRGNELDLLLMLRHRRADYALMLESETRYYLEIHPKLRSVLTIHRPEGLTEPEFTYFLCSKKVDADTMNAFNVALQQLPSLQY